VHSLTQPGRETVRKSLAYGTTQPSQTSDLLGNGEEIFQFLKSEFSH